jgi:hypothetical protein
MWSSLLLLPLLLPLLRLLHRIRRLNCHRS